MREPYKMKLASGSELALRYPFTSIAWMEAQTGGHFFTDSTAKLGTRYLVAGIAAGLVADDPEMTTAKVEAAIQRHMDAGGDLPTLWDQLVDAFKQSGVMRRAPGEATPSGERPTSAVAGPAS